MEIEGVIHKIAKEKGVNIDKVFVQWINKTIEVNSNGSETVLEKKDNIYYYAKTFSNIGTHVYCKLDNTQCAIIHLTRGNPVLFNNIYTNYTGGVNVKLSGYKITIDQ